MRSTRPCSRRLLLAWAVLAVLGLAMAARAQDAPSLFDSGRLLGTSGLGQIEGAAGGGLVPWATIAGYGTRDAIGAQVHATGVVLNDFSLFSGGIAVGLFNRVEISYARQWFDTSAYGARLGLGRGYTFHVDDVGAKVRLFGDVVYDQDSPLPQVSAGAIFKSNDRAPVLRAIGARDNQGVDVYLAATKLLLDESLLLDATLRFTRANQFGILGFGGDQSNSYQPEFEGSAAVLLSRHVAIGAEYRTKPDNLSFAREDDAYDAFAAWFVTKDVAIVAAYTNLGRIAGAGVQNGAYLSLQLGF